MFPLLTSIPFSVALVLARFIIEASCRYFISVAVLLIECIYFSNFFFLWTLFESAPFPNTSIRSITHNGSDLRASCSSNKLNQARLRHINIDTSSTTSRWIMGRIA
jgi:hypothetical protein